MDSQLLPLYVIGPLTAPITASAPLVSVFPPGVEPISTTRTLVKSNTDVGIPSDYIMSILDGLDSTYDSLHPMAPFRANAGKFVSRHRPFVFPQP